MNQIKRRFHTNSAEIKHAVGDIDIYGRMFHGHYEIYLLLSGNVDYISGHTRQRIEPYQLVIIPPGEYHQFIVRSDMDAYERCVIDIYPELLSDAGLLDALDGRELLTLSPSHRITEDIVHLIAAMERFSETDFAKLLPVLITDIVLEIKYSDDVPAMMPGELRPISVELMRYINAHFDENINLSAIAEQFFLSISSICHIFKEDFGLSIKQYILQKRMAAARQALCAGENPKEISTRCGFSDYSTFYRAYRKYYGSAPSQTKKGSADS